MVLKSVTAAVLKGLFSISHGTEIGKPDPVAQMGESPSSSPYRWESSLAATGRGSG
jgi:hypothetical protein